uniref:Uncharacterized protein n=1 Tax=Plectus sambesii TaxID=2011161 RepID=A0A914XGE9_9BILA
MWRSTDLISSDRFTFLARFLAIIVLLWTEASASESGNTVHKRQVSWNRGYGGYGGYGYYPWNNGANGYYGKSVSFPGTQTGGAFNGIVGSQNVYGPNVWDRNTGAGNINNVGGMVGVGNQYLVNVAGGSFAGPRYGYGYGYGYGYPNGQNSPYGSFGYGGYGQNIYPSPSTYSNNACSLCGIVTPPPSGTASTRGAPTPSTTPSPSRYVRTTTSSATTTSTQAPASETSFFPSRIVDQEAEPFYRSRMVIG